MKAVYDSSALLALIWREAGHEVADMHLGGGAISAVNLAEVYTKSAERGVDLDDMEDLVTSFNLSIVPFDERQALASGRLRAATRQFGLSLGDRACLALAQIYDAPVVTGDRIWQKLDLGVEIIAIR